MLQEQQNFVQVAEESAAISNLQYTIEITTDDQTDGEPDASYYTIS